MAQIWLQLAPNQGGTRFGPFAGMVQLGTHPSQCQVVIVSPGISPVHAQIWDNGNGTLSVQPAERSTLVFLAPVGRHDVWPVQQAVSFNPGDAIVLGNQNGPRLTVTNQPPSGARPAGVGSAVGGAVGGAASNAANSRFARDMRREVERQVYSRLIARNPMARELYQWMYRYRSGALFSPRYLIPAAFGLVAAFGTVCVGCFGMGAAVLQGVLGG